MAEKTEEKATVTLREQFSMPEMTRTWNELIVASTNAYYDMVGQNVRHTVELSNLAGHAMQDMVTAYGHLYQDSMKTWQEYLPTFNGIVVRR